MATDADVDMGGVPSADEIHNVVPSGTKRKAESLTEGAGAPRRIKVGKIANASRMRPGTATN